MACKKFARWSSAKTFLEPKSRQESESGLGKGSSSLIDCQKRASRARARALAVSFAGCHIKCMHEILIASERSNNSCMKTGFSEKLTETGLRSKFCMHKA